MVVAGPRYSTSMCGHRLGPRMTDSGGKPACIIGPHSRGRSSCIRLTLEEAFLVVCDRNAMKLTYERTKSRSDGSVEAEQRTATWFQRPRQVTSDK